MFKATNIFFTGLVSSFVDIRRKETKIALICFLLFFLNFTQFVISQNDFFIIILFFTLNFLILIIGISIFNFMKTYWKNDSEFQEYKDSLFTAIASLFNYRYIMENKYLGFLIICAFLGMIFSNPTPPITHLKILVLSSSVIFYESFLYIGLSKIFQEREEQEQKQEKLKYLTNNVFSDNQ